MNKKSLMSFHTIYLTVLIKVTQIILSSIFYLIFFISIFEVYLSLERFKHRILVLFFIINLKLFNKCECLF